MASATDNLRSPWITFLAHLFIWFLAGPEWSVWRTNWFVNKVFVLAAFVLVLGTALRRPEALKGHSEPRIDGVGSN
ncbi:MULTISPECIES: hypothetical protein [Marinobacter]|uniref:Uncharacterized protein n=1 Tax=Marinobacter metalliresistant TaxID=2961995 RepID=A0ABZ2W5U1_9GAMM|nr:hypothetical protein [Marinobacter sp. Arc7-DN-1]AXS82866.1 hypothetical protein D0851_07315 [Marinobacter sp. Arc7-DN-1]